MERKKTSRREFLKFLTLASVGTLAATCQKGGEKGSTENTSSVKPKQEKLDTTLVSIPVSKADLFGLNPRKNLRQICTDLGLELKKGPIGTAKDFKGNSIYVGACTVPKAD